MIKFIRELAEFYKLENDLSNITCIMCRINDDFRLMFLNYFFPNLDVSTVKDIRREIPDKKDGGSRVDLFISLENDCKPYIIEIKKEDRNHHFGQYETAYDISKNRFGYITNYNCVEGKNLGYDVKTWEDFYDYLVSFHPKDESILGYMEYIKTVCGIIKYKKPMNFNGIYSIKCFADTVKKIIEKGIDGIDIRCDRKYCYDISLHQAFYFRYNDSSDDESGYAVFGLWFYDNPVVTIGINSRPMLSEKILGDNKTNWHQYEYLSKPYQDEYWRKDDVWFNLQEDKMVHFNNADSYEQQMEILQNFFAEVMDYLKIYF